MYPEQFVTPMRQELTRVGFKDLRTADEVDAALKNESRTVLVVVNSICGCAAGKARPAIVHALQNAARPEVLATVFAGQDQEATARARSYFEGYVPSSPSIALMRDGKVAFMLERRDIESSDAFSISNALKQAFDKFCTPAAARQ
jgi:putative YphP/YqiW family bacilliredoxin